MDKKHGRRMYHHRIRRILQNYSVSREGMKKIFTDNKTEERRHNVLWLMQQTAIDQAKSELRTHTRH